MWQKISTFSCKNASNATILILNTIQCVDFWILYNVLTSEYYTMCWLLNTIQCVDYLVKSAKLKFVFVLASSLEKEKLSNDPMLIVSYKIILKGLIYYFYHLTTLKHF
jgi:hypothetical protein